MELMEISTIILVDFGELQTENTRQIGLTSHVCDFEIRRACLSTVVIHTSPAFGNTLVLWAARKRPLGHSRQETAPVQI